MTLILTFIKKAKSTASKIYNFLSLGSLNGVALQKSMVVMMILVFLVLNLTVVFLTFPPCILFEACAPIPAS